MVYQRVIELWLPGSSPACQKCEHVLYVATQGWELWYGSDDRARANMWLHVSSVIVSEYGFQP